MTDLKGIILAGGTGTRLSPLTRSISKQLLPVYDKPMIYFPISTLMLAGVREIAIITTQDDRDQFQRLLGDGHQWGISLTYLVQEHPEGLAQAYVLADGFLEGASSLMVLGDNIFFGNGLTTLLEEAALKTSGASVFAYQVKEPQRYGVLGFDDSGNVNQIIEKPAAPPSNFAVTGLYLFDGSAPAKASRVKKSSRGELEITAVIQMYLDEGSLWVQKLGRGYAWFDTGTHASLLDAGNFVRTLIDRQSSQIGCLEEIAFQKGWISSQQLYKQARLMESSSYGEYLLNLLQN